MNVHLISGSNPFVQLINLYSEIQVLPDLFEIYLKLIGECSLWEIKVHIHTCKYTVARATNRSKVSTCTN